MTHKRGAPANGFAGAWLVVLCAVFLLSALDAAAQKSPPAIETAGKHGESFQRFFEHHLAALTREGDRVRFEAAEGGNIGKYNPQRHQWEKVFSLSEGESFFQQDHHARTEFTVLEIRDDGVLIEARSLFDHRSFGSDKISRDTTVILLPYRERDPGS